MGFVAAKCTQCGANIEVDDTKEAGICKFCGTAFVTEKAINNYNTYVTNNNNFAGANINVMGADIDNLIVLAKNAQEVGNYDEAKNYYSKVLELQPTNCDALVGKGISALYSSNLGDIKSDELIGYISKAIEYKKKEENISKQDLNQFIVESAKALYQAATVVFQVSKTHYDEYWKLENSAPEYWNRLGKVVKIFIYVVSLTEPDNIRQSEEGKFCYLEGMKFIVICCVEICKQRQYVSGIVNPGQILESEVKSEIKPNASLHQTYMELYDKMCEKIKEVEEDYQPDSINRNKEIQGGCYIATSVYGSYDCPQVWTLRRFRDYTLDESRYGRAFIKYYYAISPTFVKWFGDTKWFKRFWKSKLDKIVSNLNKKGVEDTCYHDKY